MRGLFKPMFYKAQFANSIFLVFGETLRQATPFKFFYGAWDFSVAITALAFFNNRCFAGQSDLLGGYFQFLVVALSFPL